MLKLPKTKQNWLKEFNDFCGLLRIDSKDLMPEPGQSGVPLDLYGAQQRYLEEICRGLDEDVRFFVCLKARQMGISTVSLAIDIYWLLRFPGLQGCLVTDTDDNKEKFRHIIDRYIKSLPPGFCVVEKHNRTMLALATGSTLDYLVAGQKKKSTLGTSRAYNFAHLTEVSKWGGGEGLDSFMSTLSETHPNRLYMVESTAHGFNHYREMWTQAKEDKHTQRAFFIGWWAFRPQDNKYRIEKKDPRFIEHTADPPTNDEIEKQALVSEQYGHHVTKEQLAWYRWKSRNRSYTEGAMEEEFPWHEEEAFVVTGKHFFPARKLGEDIRRVLDGKSVVFKAYRYLLGEQFTGTELDLLDMQQVRHSGEAHLRVWQEPMPRGVYVIGLDPAYGRNDHQDRHAISVWRCFADRLVQVAEYATPDPETWQVIWVLAHLASLYRDCYINIEVGGPGTTVFQGLKQVRQMLRHAAAQKGEPMAPKGFTDALNGARWYMYHRPDSMGSGYAYGWKTTLDNKMHIMNQYRDFYQLGNLMVRSGPLLQEMQLIVQDGAEIEAYGKGKDDRVFAAALAIEGWVTWRRPQLRAMGHTYALVKAAEDKKELPPENDGMVGSIVKHHMRTTEEQRAADLRARQFGERPMR